MDNIHEDCETQLAEVEDKIIELQTELAKVKAENKELEKRPLLCPDCSKKYVPAHCLLCREIKLQAELDKHQGSIKEWPFQTHIRAKTKKEHLEQIDCLFGAELAKLRWIPVTERLPVLTQKIASPVPKESEEVWVSDGKQTAKAYWMGTKHWLFSDSIRLFIVTHWMPIILPEPLKDKDA